MEADEFGFSAADFKPPSLISLTPFTSSPAPRRLSSSFVPPNEPIQAAKQLSWLSFQGRLVGAEEATSAKAIAIGGGLGLEERMGWAMFSPMQRVLVVAVIAVAVANSKKNQEILRLKTSVEIRVSELVLFLVFD